MISSAGKKREREREHKKLPAVYLADEDKKNNAVPLSSLHNKYTGIFYKGKYARHALLDIFAGGIKNNFFFGLSQKSEQACFIALIDRICKLDRDADIILAKIKNAETLDDLLNILFAYFEQIQKNESIKKDDIYYKNMSALKRDINDFAEQCQIPWRIVKYNIDPTQHYTYKIRYVASQKNRKEEDNSSEKCKVEWGIVKKNINLTESKSHTYQIEYSLFRKEKEKNIFYRTFRICRRTFKITYRAFKTNGKRAVKAMSVFMAIDGLLTTLAGIVLMHLVAPVALLLLFKLFAGTFAIYLGYKFARDDLYTLGKQIFLGRIMQIKDPKTGTYKDLENYQKRSLKLLAFFCIVAGICNAALSYSNVLSNIGNTFFLPLLGTVSTVPLAYVTAGFVFILVGAEFFLTIKSVVADTTNNKITAYFRSLTHQKNETDFQYGVRIALEIIKWGIAIIFMAKVGFIGYFLFTDKSIKMLKDLLGVLTIGTAMVVSFSYSLIKFVFGVKKIIQLLQPAGDSLLQSAANIEKTLNASKTSELGSFSENKKEKLDVSEIEDRTPQVSASEKEKSSTPIQSVLESKSSTLAMQEMMQAQQSTTSSGDAEQAEQVKPRKELNRIQEENKPSIFFRILLFLGIVTRAAATGAFYYDTAINHGYNGAPFIGTTAAGYIAAMYAEPTYRSLDKKEIKPIKARQPFFSDKSRSSFLENSSKENPQSLSYRRNARMLRRVQTGKQFLQSDIGTTPANKRFVR